MEAEGYGVKIGSGALLVMGPGILRKCNHKFKYLQSDEEEGYVLLRAPY
jgi:hypothetical protein